MQRHGRSRRPTILQNAPRLVACLVLVLSLVGLYPALRANLYRVWMVQGLNVTGRPPNADEIAWDAGWQSLCDTRTPVGSDMAPISDRALSFAALAAVDRGDYATALALFQQLVTQGSASEADNAPAYVAALNMNWVAAGNAFQSQPTARHRRFWATVFYLAAQQLMFAGHPDQAAEFYRRADAGYETQGPYGGLGLVDCLVQRGRPLEAYDAYRRALATMPSEEALAHLPRFVQLRLEGLHTWHQRDPANRQVKHWLDFYKADAAASRFITETLAAAPTPRVPLELDLGGGRSLVGFDYRDEDIQTGPFMEVDFYINLNEKESEHFARVRRTVVNRAPNGAFAWDRVPRGVRPYGWHNLVYSHDLAALYPEAHGPEGNWLCLDAGLIGTSFGLQGDTMPLGGNEVYIQGGTVFLEDSAALSLGRTWFGVPDPHAYSYVDGGHEPGVQGMAGTWQAPDPATGVAVWLLSHQTSKGCFKDLYLFVVPELVTAA